MATSETITPRQLVVRAADRLGMAEESLRHPLNSRSELYGYPLGTQVGLERTGVMLARIPANRESFAPHAHACEEEWMFVLEGRGVVEIGGEGFDVAAGDFVGFPAGTYAHHVRNPHPEELVYLFGGERREMDVIDYPAAGRRAVRVGHDLKVYPARMGEPLFR